MDKWQELSAQIIDMVEEVIRRKHPKIELMASKLEGNTLLSGEVYYTLEDEIANYIKEETKSKLRKWLKL